MRKCHKKEKPPVKFRPNKISASELYKDDWHIVARIVDIGTANKPKSTSLAAE